MRPANRVRSDAFATTATGMNIIVSFDLYLTGSHVLQRAYAAEESLETVKAPERGLLLLDHFAFQRVVSPALLQVRSFHCCLMASAFIESYKW